MRLILILFRLAGVRAVRRGPGGSVRALRKELEMVTSGELRVRHGRIRILASIFLGMSVIVCLGSYMGWQ